jgi:hypothetical protein
MVVSAIVSDHSMVRSVSDGSVFLLNCIMLERVKQRNRTVSLLKKNETIISEATFRDIGVTAILLA